MAPQGNRMNVSVLAPPLIRGGWEGFSAVSERRNRCCIVLNPPCSPLLRGETVTESSRLESKNRLLNFHSIAPHGAGICGMAVPIGGRLHGFRTH